MNNRKNVIEKNYYFIKKIFPFDNNPSSYSLMEYLPSFFPLNTPYYSFLLDIYKQDGKQMLQLNNFCSREQKQVKCN